MAKTEQKDREVNVVVLTDEQLLAIEQTSQEFADLSMADKLRFYQVQNSALRKANTELAASTFDKDGLKVGNSGTLSLQIPSSYPVSLYRDQWPTVIAAVKSGAIERKLAAEPKIINRPPKAKK